jgi:hypothetical protein
LYNTKNDRRATGIVGCSACSRLLLFQLYSRTGVGKEYHV